MLELRNYQKSAVQHALADLNTYHKSLIVLPTGTGKTVCMAKTASELRDQGKTILLLAHQEHLLNQAANAFRSFGMEPEMLKTDWNHSPVTFCTVQKMKNRLDQFQPDDIDIIIIDECHHTPANSYKVVIQHFPDAMLMGVTATPLRSDDKSLKPFYRQISYSYQIENAIEDGWLTPICAKTIPLEIDLSSTRYTAGKYADTALSHTLIPYLEQIVEHIGRECADRKTVVFLPTIQISRQFTQMLNDTGVSAVHVDGYTKDRSTVFEKFRSGEFQVLSNAQLVSEGWDCPEADCIIILRPTESLPFYQQMIGRGLRTAPGKQDCLILDFLWLSGKHQLCTPADLFADEDEEVNQMMKNKLKSSRSQLNLQNLRRNIRSYVERKKRELSLAKKLKEAAEQMKKRIRNMAHLAIEITENGSIALPGVKQIGTDQASAWQRQKLSQLGYNTSHVYLTSQYAALLIYILAERQKNGLASVQDLQLLNRYGFKMLAFWTRQQASSMIQILKNNDMVLPASIRPEAWMPM